MTDFEGNVLLIKLHDEPNDRTVRAEYQDWLKERGLWTVEYLLRLMIDYPGSEGVRRLAETWFTGE